MRNTNKNILIRQYEKTDAPFLAAIYFNTIHHINIKDYSTDQVNAWAPKTSLEIERWLKKWEKLPPIVAMIDNKIVGFAEFEENGHIDCFYCHHEYQSCGIGSALLHEIEQKARENNINKIFAEVSITAKPFFEANGFRVLRQQTVEIRGQKLINFVMDKIINLAQLKKESIQEQQILELLKVNYGINAQSVQLLPLGADSNAFVYKASAISNAYFVKIKYGDHEEVHLSILRLLHDANIKEIIFPILTVDGKLFRRQEHFKIIVYPFIDGQNGFEKKLIKLQWIELGKTLKRIHVLSVPIDLQQQLRKETFSAKWREKVRSLYSVIESYDSNDEITKNLKNFFKLKSDAIHRLVDTAEELSKKIEFDVRQYVLCHSDIHAGNILITSDSSFYIVDWDDPMMAPKERDLMFIGGGVGNVWNLSQEETYFYEGYGEANIDKTLLSYYRHERIVVDIAEFCQDILSDNFSDQSRLVMLNHFQSMFEPKGVVEIAFNMKL